MLRRAVDRAAAERGSYVRLATVVPALAAPEGAVVAAFERIDLVALDAIAEIVSDGVEPDRALADHAFAHRLARRAGTGVVVGPGSLVVAPDLSAGLPSDPATRSGRALALQLLGVALARGDGLPPGQVVIGALPPWVTDEPAPAARAVAEVALRRALFPGHPFAFVEPPAGHVGSTLWPYVQAAAAVHAGEVAFVLRRYEPSSGDGEDEGLLSLRAGSAVAAEVAATTLPGALTGPALAHARSMVAAAMTTIEGLADRGWGTVTGESPGSGRPARGRDAVAERTEPFDPFEASLGLRR